MSHSKPPHLFLPSDVWKNSEKTLPVCFSVSINDEMRLEQICLLLLFETNKLAGKPLNKGGKHTPEPWLRDLRKQSFGSELDGKQIRNGLTHILLIFPHNYMLQDLTQKKVVFLGLKNWFNDRVIWCVFQFDIQHTKSDTVHAEWFELVRCIHLEFSDYMDLNGTKITSAFIM